VTRRAIEFELFGKEKQICETTGGVGFAQRPGTTTMMGIGDGWMDGFLPGFESG
jgi:hypothetical protein